MEVERIKRKRGRSAAYLIGAASCLMAVCFGSGAETAAGQEEQTINLPAVGQAEHAENMAAADQARRAENIPAAGQIQHAESLPDGLSSGEKSDGTDAAKAFSLTEAEKEYLDGLRGKRLVLGVPEASGWSGEKDSRYGAAVPVAELFGDSFGLDIEVVSGSWESLRNGLQEGSVDFLFGVPVPDQEGMLKLSDAELFCAGELYENSRLLIVREGESPAGLYGGGCRVGLVRGEAAAELFVPWLERTGEPVYYADAKQLFAAVVSGEADAALITGSMAAELYPYRELEVGGVLGQLSRGGTIGTAKQELAGVIGLLDRFLQTAEGEALRSAVQEQQKLYARRLIAAEEQEALQAAAQKYSALRFVWDGADSSLLWRGEDGKFAGTLPDFFGFVTACTGFEIEVAESAEGSSPEALLGGEAQLAVGLLGGDWGGEALRSFRAGDTELVAVIPSETASEFTAGHVASLYWGAAADIFSYLEGTVFDGHAVAFEREEKLLPALGSGEVGGILLCRETAEYAVLEGGADGLRILPEFRFPVQRVFLFQPGDEVLCSLMERLYHTWSSLEGQPGKRAAQLQLLSEYALLEKDGALWLRKVMFWRIAGSVLLAVLLVLSAALIRSRTALRAKKKQQKPLNAGRSREKGAAVPSGLHRLDEHIAARLVKEIQPQQKDALTGLLTESGAQEPIREVLERCRDTAAVFAYLDMDDFKSINEAYGYDTGDEMLVSFTECLKTLVFDENTVIFRKEGDRFGAFRGNLASQLDRSIFLGELQSLSAQVRVGGKLVSVAYRCGAALSEQGAEAPEELAKRAVEAVDHCKKNHLSFFLK